MTLQEANQKVQEWIDAGNKNTFLILDVLTSARGLTPSAFRKMRIFSSVVSRLPFIV